MTITNGYTDQATFKARFLSDYSATAQDDQIDAVIQATSRLIDLYTGREFYSSSAQTRYFTPAANCRCYIDDLQSVTTLKTDTDSDGVYDTTWAAGDYWLMPINPKNGEPYTFIEVKPWGSQSFDCHARQSVQIAGTFGWAAVPDVVREACLIQSFRIYKRSGAPFGIVGGGEFGTAQAIPDLDPDVKTMLGPVTRFV